jgi:DnaJ-class molecular chaperone
MNENRYRRAPTKRLQRDSAEMLLELAWRGKNQDKATVCQECEGKGLADYGSETVRDQWGNYRVANWNNQTCLKCEGEGYIWEAA